MVHSTSDRGYVTHLLLVNWFSQRQSHEHHDPRCKQILLDIYLDREQIVSIQSVIWRVGIFGNVKVNNSIPMASRGLITLWGRVCFTSVPQLLRKWIT